MKTHLGHYEILAELGRGGMGVVYKGFEPALNRHVAIKELAPALAHDQNLVERFLREARSMAALNDPRIIQIYFIGTDESSGQPFFVMEFVEGESLSQALKREGKLSVENALKIVHQAAQGLASAHDNGVIHRDIKPGNLMVTPRGQVKIADFGIALASTDFSKKLTSTGEFVGTPGYLSPEVCLGKPVDRRSDIFSLGIVLYEMLSGDTPFRDESPLGLMLEVVKTEIPDIRGINREVDAETAALLSRMLAKDPAERFQNCHELAVALAAHPLVAQGGPIKLAAAVSNEATVAGAPAPGVAPRVSAPPRVSTPPVVAPAASATRASRPRPSVLNRPERRGSSRAALIAVGLMAFVVIGSAFAFRGTLAEFVKGFADGFTNKDAYEGGVAAGKASNPIGASAAAENTSLAGPSMPENASTSALIAADSATPSNASAINNAPATPAPNEPGASSPLAPPTAAADSGKPAEATMTAASTAQTATANPPAQQIAKATPPRRPHAPKIAVVAIGDNAIASPAQQRVEAALTRAGFDLLDVSLIKGMADAVYQQDLAAVLAALKSDADALVVVRAEPIGSQWLTYYGESSKLYSVFLGLRAYAVSDRHPLSAGIREKVDFTILNAQEKAHEVVEPGLTDLLEDLAPYRRPAQRG